MIDQLLAFYKEEVKVNNSKTKINLDNVKGIIMVN